MRPLKADRVVTRPRTLVAASMSALLWFSAAAPSLAVSPADLPSPLSGPGVAELKRGQQKKIRQAWQEFLAGDLAASRKKALRAGDLVPTRLLELQILLTQGEASAFEGLGELCESHPDYAAAWVTLSLAAEAFATESESLAAAEQAASLWSEPPWNERPARLYRRWVDDRIQRAGQLLAGGDTEEAASELEAARSLDPERSDAAVMMAEILVANDMIADAELILSDFPDVPEAAFLRGDIAEMRGDWQAAMEWYSTLPSGYPGRDEGLERAQIRWRLTLLPGYARAAMAAHEMTRGDLAVVLVSVRPQLETLPGDRVPVMSDIVDHPGHREIITVVRLGIMSADRMEHRFFPDAPVSMDTVRDAIQRTRALLGLTAPIWCTESDVVGSGCLSITPPPSGGAVVQAVLDHQPGVSR
jgi:tetratricopeptide (TPR) repeat protein